MIELDKLVSIMEELAPAKIADHYDPPRYQVEPKAGEKVEKIGVCVDPTETNLRSASRKGVELLICHHSWQGEAAAEVETKGMGIYLLHSAWNKAREGNNITLARLLNLVDPVFEGDAVLGTTDLPFKDLLACCRRILEINFIPYTGDLNSQAGKVAVVSGPGFWPVYKEKWNQWLAGGCRTILSAELSRYSIGYFSRHNTNLVDLGHSVMAKPGMKHLAYTLQNRLKIFDCEVGFFPDTYSINYHTGSIYPGMGEYYTEEED